MEPGFGSVSLLRVSPSGAALPAEDFVAAEAPLEIRVRGRRLAVTMRTPGHDDELATGFLLAEGVIADPAQVTAVGHCLRGPEEQGGNVLNVFLSAGCRVPWRRLTRHLFAASSCGICGKAAIESIHAHFPPLVPERGRTPWVGSEVLRGLPDVLRKSQRWFEKTGGMHAAGLFSASGGLVVVREDVGRHNAVDKVLGYAARSGIYPLGDHLLLVSGRVSFEIMQKALAARIPLVAGVSAPSSLAVEFAEESGQTLVGFLRGNGFNLYSHPGRVVVAAGRDAVSSGDV